MTAKAQRDYYAMPPAGEALTARIDAMVESIPKGSVVLDIGCNDGTISNTLLERGAILKSYGFDLEDILVHRRPEIVFRKANLKHFDLSQLPDADGVLILNLLHHIVAFSKERAKEIVDTLLNRYAFVILDMGSFTETGGWGWRASYDTHWKSDGEMWDFFFANAQWRFKLSRYPTQGNGHRTLWKLYKEPYALDDLEDVDTFRRTPGSWPAAKKLIRTAELGETKVVTTVQFALVQSRRGDRFWTKQYLNRDRDARAALEMEIASFAAREMEFINSRTQARMRVARPVALLEDGKLVFPFEPDLFAATVVHFQDWAEFFEPPVSKAGHVLATRSIELSKDFPRMSLLQACDFQLCTSWDGLTALDFEPNNWLAHVAHTGALKMAKM
jgi:SAM-dependent methyltransferase